MFNMSNLSTGYGALKRLFFDDHKQNYELWEVKFVGYMKIQKLHSYMSMMPIL